MRHPLTIFLLLICTFVANGQVENVILTPVKASMVTGHFRSPDALDTTYLELYSSKDGKILDSIPSPDNDFDLSREWYFLNEVSVRCVMREIDTLFFINAIGIMYDTVLVNVFNNGLDALAFIVDYADDSNINTMFVWFFHNGKWIITDSRVVNEFDTERFENRNGQWWIHSWSDYSDELDWHPLEDRSGYLHLCGMKGAFWDMDTGLFRSLAKKDFTNIHFLNQQGYDAMQLPEIIEPMCWSMLEGNQFQYLTFEIEGHPYPAFILPMADWTRKVRFSYRGYKARPTPKPDYVVQFSLNGHLAVLCVSNPNSNKEQILNRLAKVMWKYLKKSKR